MIDNRTETVYSLFVKTHPSKQRDSLARNLFCHEKREKGRKRRWTLLDLLNIIGT